MKLDSQRAREIGRLGGIACARSKKTKRGLRQILTDLLACNSSTILDDTAADSLTAGEILARSLIRQAADGNIKAAEFIRDTIGEKPGTKPDPSASDKPQPAEIRIKVVE